MKSFLDLNQIEEAGAKESTTSFAAWKYNAKDMVPLDIPVSLLWMFQNRHLFKLSNQDLNHKLRLKIHNRSFHFCRGFQIYLLPLTDYREKHCQKLWQVQWRLPKCLNHVHGISAKPSWQRKFHHSNLCDTWTCFALLYFPISEYTQSFYDWPR